MSKEKILKEFDEKFNRYKLTFDECASLDADYWEAREYLIKAIAQTREETLKELIREYQDNELDGNGYDFYFSIRAKIDELNKLNK